MELFISAEGDLPKELEPFRLKIPSIELHNVMAHATLVVGDGATTATEAAVMGVPSLYLSTFADSLGYCRLLHQYGLLTSVKGEEEGIDAIKNLISNLDLENRKKQVQKLLDDSIDLVEYMVEKICDYKK